MARRWFGGAGKLGKIQWAALGFRARSAWAMFAQWVASATGPLERTGGYHHRYCWRLQPGFRGGGLQLFTHTEVVAYC